MKIFPSCEVKMLSECLPGQLVRMLRSGLAHFYCIVCSTPMDGKVGIVWIDGNTAKFDMYDEADTEAVLAYDGDLIWEVNQDGPFEPPVKQIFEMSGCLVVAKGAKYLNVTRSEQTPRTKLQLNLDDGSVGQYQERLRDAAIFGSWKLFLEDADRPIENRALITEFCVKAGD